MSCYMSNPQLLSPVPFDSNYIKLLPYKLYFFGAPYCVLCVSVCTSLTYYQYSVHILHILLLIGIIICTHNTMYLLPMYMRWYR